MPTIDTRFVLQGITFIWDENKTRENPHRDEMTGPISAFSFQKYYWVSLKRHQQQKFS